MFRSTTIIRELVLNLAKIIFMLKHFMLFGDMAECHRAVCVMCAVHKTHTPLCDMLPHHQITYDDVILPSVST